MNEVTALVARLRLAGCKVSTVIGHDPNIGEYYYRVTVPKGIHAAIVGRTTNVTHLTTIRRGGPFRDDTVAVRTYRRPFGLPEGERRAAEAERSASTAKALAEVLRRIEAFDREGSASRQHYIDTGFYLTTEDLGPHILSTHNLPDLHLDEGDPYA